MSKYLLYGQKIIKDDANLKNFVESIINDILEIKEIKAQQIKSLNDETLFEVFESEVYQLFYSYLIDDISRTDIDYQRLMKEYRHEIGDLLYEIENQGIGEKPDIYFFGEKAQSSFEYLVLMYFNVQFKKLFISKKIGDVA